MIQFVMIDSMIGSTDTWTEKYLDERTEVCYWTESQSGESRWTEIKVACFKAVQNKYWAWFQGNES